MGDDLLTGQPERARSALEEALRTRPRDGYLHLLYGLSYELADQSPQGLEMAKVGYDMAGKFAADFYWTHYLLGSVALERREFHEAAQQFSQAILEDPDRPHAFVGLAVAAYYTGDLAVARIAADRAYALEPLDPFVARTAAYVAAAGGDEARLDAILAEVETDPKTARDVVRQRPRLDQLLRVAAVEKGQTRAPEPQPQATGAEHVASVDGPKQVMVEVTLLLSQNASTRHTGLNLLDGLFLEFGIDYITEKNILSEASDTFSKMFTTALTVPKVSYSLNIFNTRDDYYAVLARPSLVATLGEQSAFFIGRTINVGVSGINLGSVQPIDVGTSVTVTPLEISHERAKFHIDTDRAFLVDEAGGTFAEALTTFKQTVGATVEVDFGHTLVLSGLYETVNFGGNSKVPGAGDVPGLKLLFNDRTRTQKKDAAIILVTPYLPGTIETGPAEFRSESLARLLSLWNRMVDPASNMDSIIDEITKTFSWSFRPQSGDLHAPATADPKTVNLIVNETLSRL